MKWIKSIAVVAFYLMQVSMVPVGDEKSKEKKGIEFHSGSWDNALALAKKENKLVFLDISASWCGPCRMLKSNTFPNEEVGKFYNANFINVALDGEKGEGIALAREYAISAYPALLFVNGDGKLVSKTLGYHNAEKFLKLGQKINKKYQ